ncbi:MAG: hypothetical protein QMC89_06545 [Candidatus Hodarchaeaceae archaeon]|nr:hypothetical protein [Candidatus Hodarchaeaceae archaeon]
MSPTVRPTILHLGNGERERIEEFVTKTKSPREYKRAQAVLCKSKGMSATEVAEIWKTA